MTDLNKLADALENIAHMEYPSGHHDGNNLCEAAALLRAAGAADVGGLMAQAQVFASAWSLVGTRFDSGDEIENAESQKAALESALRLALAAREGFVMVPLEPTPEMLEACQSVEPVSISMCATLREADDLNNTAFYRAMIAAAPKGTT